MSYIAYGSQKDYEESQGIGEPQVPLTKVFSDVLKDMNHWCSRTVDRTNGDYFKDKYDYQTRQDITQR